jgi:hypothetical protein
MKKVLFLLVAIIALVGCKSKEEKAAEMIKKELFKTLYDFDSYQPIETKVDSAFYSAYTDSMVLKHGYMLNQLIKEINKAVEEVKDAREIMDIWGIDTYSSYGRSKYYEARDKAKEALNKGNIYSKMMDLESDTIRLLSRNIKHDFCGWKATHKFRCKTKGGNPSIGNYIYFFDKNMKHIIFNEDIEDENLTQVRNLIKEAIENDSIKAK